MLWSLLLASALPGYLKTYLFPVLMQLNAALCYTRHLSVGEEDVPTNACGKTLKIAGSVPEQTDEVNVQTG